MYVNNIKNNIFTYRKIFIHKYVILFNFLNIEFKKEYLNMIDEFYILNLLATFYLLNLLHLSLINEKNEFKLTKEKSILNYSVNIILKYYNTLNNKNIDYNHLINNEYKTLNDIEKIYKDEYFEAYPLFIGLKLINGVSFNSRFNKNCYNISENKINIDIQNDILNQYFVITNKQNSYQNCMNYNIKSCFEEYFDKIFTNINNVISNVNHNEKEIYLKIKKYYTLSYLDLIFNKHSLFNVDNKNLDLTEKYSLINFEIKNDNPMNFETFKNIHTQQTITNNIYIFDSYISNNSKKVNGYKYIFLFGGEFKFYCLHPSVSRL